MDILTFIRNDKGLNKQMDIRNNNCNFQLRNLKISESDKIYSGEVSVWFYPWKIVKQLMGKFQQYKIEIKLIFSDQ